MKPNGDIDRLDKLLANRLRREPAAFDFEQWTRDHPAEAGLLRSGFAEPASSAKTLFEHIWRCIMRSPYTRYVGIAVVLLVALSFLFPGRRGIVPESVAWADVQKAIEDVRSARVTGTRSCFFSGDEAPTYKLRVEKLFSHSGYVDRTFTEDGRLIIEFTYHLPTGTVTVLFPTYKKYYRTQVPPEVREKVSQVTPMKLFEWLFASGDYRRLDPEEVQGIHAVGFEVPDLIDRLTSGLQVSGKLVDFFLSIGQSSTRMWVNPETRLPVQVEFEGKVNPCLVTGYREMTLREIDDRWKRDVELDDVQFLPAIPEDYQELTLPGGAALGAATSSVALAAVVPSCIFLARRSRRRVRARRAS
jgi:hypothetical protein